MSKAKQSFEENMRQLEQIVRAMERGDAKLDESLKLFQEGTQLVRECAKLLDAAELQIKKVMTAADGSPVLEDFADDTTAE
ncbi:MAG: exodeoxyribonuclease VII small subunit [Oscillospiraceae bacterium]|nr:exodeoxyribonuclease VII small subunit [Oscillospiraceae bacterium]